ncbi:zinc finger protein [Branchiostoma belcheri]|nr:zinc finger protein [Branchiostoma belcheri]
MVQPLGKGYFDISFRTLSARRRAFQLFSDRAGLVVFSYGGDDVVVVTATHIPGHLDDNYVRYWLSQFCTVQSSRFCTYSHHPSVKNGTRQYRVILKPGRHIPGVTHMGGQPTFFRYLGQPLICGKCGDHDHVGKDCPHTICVRAVKIRN